MPGKGSVEPVAPVIFKGCRYEAVEKPALRDLDPAAGYVVAIDTASDSELWVAKVFESDLPEDIEAHKRNVAISQLKLTGLFSKKLLVVTERGDKFKLDPETREVTKA